MPENFSEAKVFRLGEVAGNFQKRVTELELQVKPSTTPEVLEERIKATTEAVTKIKEVEALCAKVVKQVSHSWEALINDEELERVTEQLRATEAEVNQLKNEVRQ